MAAASFTDGYVWSRDGLRLHYRDWAGDAARPVLLCLPGLTRNARDFDALGARLAPRFRVVALSLRGRGESAYAKDPLTYVPLTYLQDIEVVLRHLDLRRVVVVGTSLGGLLAMMLGVTHRGLVAGAVLNDIGPTIEPEGLARVRGLVGRSTAWPTWVHVARDMERLHGAQHPKFGLPDWLAFAKRVCRVTAAGRIVGDHDPRIADPFRLPHDGAGVDQWHALDALGAVPVLSLRGELSDILAPATVARMATRLQHFTAVTVAATGHAPTLEEPEAVAAIDALLADVG
jgi:pimeloyl-ACP methyl ester carboxylesterase